MAQLANDPNQANMAQQTLEATGDVPVYQQCGIGTSWHSDQSIILIIQPCTTYRRLLCMQHCIFLFITDSQ